MIKLIPMSFPYIIFEASKIFKRQLAPLGGDFSATHIFYGYRTDSSRYSTQTIRSLAEWSAVTC